MNPTTKRLLTYLMEKCFQNDLSFRVTPKYRGLVDVWDLDNKPIEVSIGYLTDSHETPTEILNRMHDEVDEYINLPTYEEDDIDYQTEKARAVMTENERKMKESGHKLSDFM